MEAELIDYHPSLAGHFHDINDLWLRTHFYVEPHDSEVLSDPDKYLLQKGGKIIFAKLGDKIVGTVALMPVEPGVYEMTKMGVLPEARGFKVGKLLANGIIVKARELGASKVILYSNTTLPPAVQLYRTIGFREILLEAGRYARADIKMELPLYGKIPVTERNQLIKDFGDAPDHLEACLSKIPQDIWKWKLSEERWSIHENIIHLADSEANAFIRLRRLMAEPGKDVIAYDQDGWVVKCDYHSQSTEDALEVYRGLRRMSLQLLKNMPEDCWEHSVKHPEHGLLGMEKWLQLYSSHTHIGHINRTYTQWKKANGVEVLYAKNLKS